MFCLNGIVFIIIIKYDYIRLTNMFIEIKFFKFEISTKKISMYEIERE